MSSGLFLSLEIFVIILSGISLNFYFSKNTEKKEKEIFQVLSAVFIICFFVLVSYQIGYKVNEDSGKGYAEAIQEGESFTIHALVDRAALAKKSGEEGPLRYFQIPLSCVRKEIILPARLMVTGKNHCEWLDVKEEKPEKIFSLFVK